MNQEDDGGQEFRKIDSALSPLASPDAFDPVIEAYKKDVDRTLIRENLKLSYRQRLQKLEMAATAMMRWRGAARRTSGQGQEQE
ncbi:MAG: hypothetical protein AB9869_10150 [Verrucomicrobiia bacterium]